MQIKSLAAFAAIVLSLLACNANNESKNELVDKVEDREMSYQNKDVPFADSIIPTPKVKGNSVEKEPAIKAVDPEWDKKIIKTGTLDLEVKDYKDFSNRVKDFSRNYGGYIANEQQEQTDRKIENNITIKVPVEQFEPAMNELANAALKINERRITSDDVTMEMVDTKGRMETKKQVRGKYLEFLEQAKNMQDVLTVQSAINGIQQELESAGSRMQYLGHASAYSTINLTYSQIFESQEPVEPAADNSFAGRAGNSFSKGWGFIKELLLGMLSVWPLLLLIAGIIFFVKKKPVSKTAAQSKVESGH